MTEQIVKKQNRKPTAKQIIGVKKTLENLGSPKPKSQGEILREVGYAESIAENPQIITESKGWQMLMEKALADKLLTDKHKELFDQKQIEYFVFPKRMSDEEIIEHVSSAGLTVITVRESDKGKMAFYSIPNAQAVSKALDMAYKLKGRYAADRLTPPGNNTYNLFYQPQFQQHVKQFEAGIKDLIANENTRTIQAETQEDISA